LFPAQSGNLDIIIVSALDPTVVGDQDTGSCLVLDPTIVGRLAGAVAFLLLLNCGKKMLR
jgi:hypothetical protein